MKTLLEARSAQEFFVHLEASLRKTQKYFSIESWSKRLGYRSPRGLSMVLKGKRLPSEDMIRKISQDLSWSDTVFRYLKNLVKRDRILQLNSVDKRDLVALEEKMEELRSRKHFQSDRVDPNAEGFELNWYTFALRQYFKIFPGPAQLEQISTYFKGKIDEEQLRKEMQSLEKFGLLQKNEKGFFIDEERAVEINDGIVSSKVKAFHTQCLQRSLESLFQDPIEKREHLSLTLSFDEQKTAEAIEEMQKFCKEFRSRFAKTDCRQMVQLNLQFYFLSQD